MNPHHEGVLKHYQGRIIPTSLTHLFSTYWNPQFLWLFLVVTLNDISENMNNMNNMNILILTWIQDSKPGNLNLGAKRCVESHV